MDAFLGTIMPVGFTFPPPNWAFCNGQMLPVAQNKALSVLLGTTYGGDGVNNFGIPDLRGYAMIGINASTSNGMTQLAMGATTGASSVNVQGQTMMHIVMQDVNLPSHTHNVTVTGSGISATSTLNVTSQTGGATAPVAGATLSSTNGITGATQAAIYQTASPPASTMMALNSDSVVTTVNGSINTTSSLTGQLQNTLLANQSVPTAAVTMPVMQPSIGLYYIICTAGYFPAPGPF